MTHIYCPAHDVKATWSCRWKASEKHGPVTGYWCDECHERLSKVPVSGPEPVWESLFSWEVR